MSSIVAHGRRNRTTTTPPQLTARDYARLGQQPDAPLDLCIRAYDHLARECDPRHRPPEQQPLWLGIQNDLDEAMSFISDVARIGRAA